jgi:ligand-binding SRPBCC domain-containing protein
LKTEITHWEPPYRFVDKQVRGPYKSWVHQHRFEEIAAGTRMTDLVEYAVPGLIFAPFFHKLFVQRDVERIFAYRRIKFGEIFGDKF